MEFVLAATSGRRARAEALLAADPEIARDPWARLTLGEGWDGDASEPGGPNGWAPLLYVCFSVFASVDLARELLARGADPNVTFKNEYGDMPALYGAAGVIHNPELTRVLLEAGANADDGESPYHATEARDPECLRLVLEYGGNPEPIVLAHALDYDHPEHVKVLLAAGADASELLPFAVRRGRGPEILRLLVEHGAQLEARGGEDWRKPERRRTAYQHAVLRGRDDSAQTLAELGADTHVDADDLAVAAIARGERPDVVPTDLDYDQQEVLILYALARRDGARRRPVRARTSAASSAARRRARCSSTSAGSGHAEHARFLVGAGAAIGDAFEWCVHGSQNHAIARPRLRRRGRSARRRHRGASPGAGGRSAGRVARSTAPTVSPNAT